MKFTVSIIALITLLSACDGPISMIPGGELNGEEAPLVLADLPEEGGVIALETNPADPYSVYVGYRVLANNMYIDPAEGRKWYQHIKANDLVRIRFDGSEIVHPAQAILATDQAIISQFDSDRHVLMIVPR